MTKYKLIVVSLIIYILIYNLVHVVLVWFVDIYMIYTQCVDTKSVSSRVCCTNRITKSRTAICDTVSVVVPKYGFLHQYNVSEMDLALYSIGR